MMIMGETVSPNIEDLLNHGYKSSKQSRPLLQKNEAFHGGSTHIPNIAAFQLRFRQKSTRRFLNRVCTETQGSWKL